jgi:alanine racemase
MDLLIVDVTDLPEGKVNRGDMAELIGAHVSLDEVAARAGTIGYEVLTSLGERYKRLYTGKTAAAAES